MNGKFAKIVMSIVAMVLVLAFLAVPVVKLKSPAMLVIILIGVAAMIFSFIDFVREKDD